MFLSFKAWESQEVERVDELYEVMVMKLKFLYLSAQNNHNIMFIPLPRPSYWVPQNNPGFMGCPGLTHKTRDPAL
jgi:hypothetical protein